MRIPDERIEEIERIFIGNKPNPKNKLAIELRNLMLELLTERNSKDDYIEKLEDIVKDTVKLTAHVKHMYKNISVAGGKVLAKNAEKKLIDLEKFKCCVSQEESAKNS